MTTAETIQTNDSTLATDISGSFTHEQMAEYTKLSYIAYSGCYLPASWGVELMVKQRLAQFAPDQELVWGPVALRAKLFDLFTVALVYVVKREDEQTGKTVYTTVFRGTNPLSWTSLFVQDLMLRQQVPWTIASPSSVRPEATVDPKAAVISAGANITLNKLKGIKSSGKTLTEFLKVALEDEHAELHFTGHSLGGLSSMMYPIYLVNECLYEGIDIQGRLKIGALAAPSPGDTEFAAYTDALLDSVGCDYIRIVNTLDVVNVAWNKDAIASDMSGVYMPTIVPTKSDKSVINGYYNLSSDCDYQQPNPSKTFNFDKGVMNLPENVLTDFSNELADKLFPSGEWPLTWTVQSLAQHVFGYPEEFLVPEESEKLMNALSTEMAFFCGPQGIMATQLKTA